MGTKPTTGNKQKTIFELSSAGRRGMRYPKCDVPETKLPAGLIREDPMPELSEGGLVYGNSANLNALLEIARPGDLRFDVIHINLHKTFATPHGGGPGSGPICAKVFLADYIPSPVACILEEATEELPPLYGLKMPEKCVGQVRSFREHFGVMVKAYVFILMEGEEGLHRVSE